MCTHVRVCRCGIRQGGHGEFVEDLNAVGELVLAYFRHIDSSSDHWFHHAEETEEFKTAWLHDMRRCVRTSVGNLTR